MKRAIAPLGLPLVALLALAPLGRAEEITYRDPATCAHTTVRAQEIVSETWTEVTYRERVRGPTKTVPTALVLDVTREVQTAESRDLLNAVAELRRGSAGEAIGRLGDLSGGGWRTDPGSGDRQYRPFTSSDPPGRGQRPPWTSEYAHFFYAKALFLDGEARKNRERIEEAYLALEDQPVPRGTGRTGGFLERFKEGNSRWYAEAMLLKARALLRLERYDEAEKAFRALADKAASIDIGAEWTFEAALGPGLIAEARGKAPEAINHFTDASNFMRLRLEGEGRHCVRLELGRYFSRARVAAARVMLHQAEKGRSAAEFRALRTFLDEGSPEALRRNHRRLPAPHLDALVAGAMDPEVQALTQNGLGLAYLQEKDYENALLVLRGVAVKYFSVPEEHARALHYLAQAADGAAKAASGEEARRLYGAWRDQALLRLRSDHPESPWAKR